MFYLVRRAAKGSFWIGELWSTDLTSGRAEREVPDFLIRNFDVANDGRHVVFDAFDASGRSAIWVATRSASWGVNGGRWSWGMNCRRLSSGSSGLIGSTNG